MRKSKSRSKARLAASAGLTTGAVGAALLVAPAAAFAAVSVTPPVAAPGDSVTIVDTDATFVTGSTTAASRVQILTSPGTTTPVCASAIATASTTILATDQTQTSSSNTTKSVTFKLPAGVTAGTNGQVKKYVACVYDYAAGTTARQGNQNGYTINVGTPTTLNPPIGFTGGGNVVNITATTNVFTNVSTIGAQFSSAGECPTTYGAPVANLATTVNKTGDNAANLTVPAGVVTTANPTKYAVCFYNGAASSSALITGGQYTASQLALSQNIGPWQGGNGLNITSQNEFLAGIDDPGVLVRTAACPNTYAAANVANANKIIAADKVRKLSTTRLAVTVPQVYDDQSAATTAFAVNPVRDWNICVYTGTTDTVSTLVAGTPYKVTTIQTSTGITPKAGPALGGSMVTVTGTAFPTEPGALTATLGGVPLVDITPLSATAFTARTTRRAPANNVSLVVTTASGSHTLSNAFSYNSALLVGPNTAPNNRAVEVVVNGVGFENAPFTNTLSSGAHIFLVKGSYNSADIGSTTRANSPVADCSNVLVLSDTELICKLDLTSRLDAAGAAVLAATPTAGNAVVTAAGSRVITGTAFASTDIGKAVIDPVDSDSKIPAGTVITDVVSATKAVMSNAATGVATASTVTLASPITQTATATTSNGSTALSAISPALTSADVGKFIIGAGIPAGRSIATQSGATGTLNDGTSVTSGGAHPVILSGTKIPVPDGAYNLQYVSNAAVNAVVTDPAYVQSQVSSTSTFTVASF
ncbi:IPT/TIG domain-containing protein [Actinoplanes subglobosus]|uniref:IPT/TIG domain-containing protein n=1 Tax=Actinoplanes subglobosus TaxID=1547892 RepID=A0ABV8IKE1_9ACTN